MVELFFLLRLCFGSVTTLIDVSNVKLVIGENIEVTSGGNQTFFTGIEYMPMYINWERAPG